MLRVQALGPMRVEADGAAIEAPAARRAWALLAWLALHPGAHPRGELAARFWPDVLDASARASLRTAVWALRRDLGPGAGALVTTADHVGLDPARVWVDALAFGELHAAGRLEEAVALCGGELLAGVGDDWALEARAAHRARLGAVLEELAVRAEAAGDAGAALDCTRRQTALDPFDEEACRRLMARLASGGQRAAALAAYERLRERLRRELHVTPSPATREAARALLADEPGTAATAEPERATAPVAPPARLLPLAGRERELGALLEAWAAARAGTGGVATLTGEAGLGKTRLARELLDRARADGARAATGAALDLGLDGARPAGAALGPWAELIAELGRDLEPPPAGAAWPAHLAPLVPDVARRLAGGQAAAHSAASPDLERVRVHEATVELVEWAARRRPVALVLEDVHLADTASLELIAYAGRRAARLPVLLVLTRRPLPRRPEVDAVEHALRSRGALLAEVALDPLPAGAVASLARAVAPLGDAGVAQVVSAAEGNALLAVESARALARGEREPPASLRGAMRAALAPLAPEPRLLAECAAAAGRDLTRAEVGRLPVADVARAARAAVEAGVLVAGTGRLGYRHALLRDAVYADLPEPHRAWVHEHLAAALAGDRHAAGPAAEVARHLRLAGRDADAVGALRRAARHAWRMGALDEAAGFLAEAAELAPEDGALLLDVAEVEAWRGRGPAAGAAFERAAALLEAAGEPVALAGAWVRRANWSRGPVCAPREVLAAGRRAVAILDATGADDAVVRAEALAACAWAEAVAGDPDAADALLARVNPDADGDDLLRHTVEHARAFALIRRGRFADSYAPSIAAGELAEAAGRPDLSYGAWINAACAAACAGDFERALSFVDRGARAVAGTGLRALEVHYLAARAYVLVRMGRREEARAASDAEAALAERSPIAELEATARHDRGMVALALGDLDRAQALLGGALADGARVSRPLARLARAEALAGLGRVDDAEAELRATALEPVAPSDFPDTLVPRLLRVQGLVAAGRGNHALAVRRLEEAAAGWRRRLDRGADGERYAAALADLGRPPVAGLVEPDRELRRVEADLRGLPPARA